MNGLVDIGKGSNMAEQEYKECLECALVGSSVFVGTGVYAITTQRQKWARVGGVIMIGIGLARMGLYAKRMNELKKLGNS